MELQLVQGTWLQANLLRRYVGRQCRVAFLQYLVYNSANTATYTACNTNTVTYITCSTLHDYAFHYSNHSYTTFSIIRHNKNKFKYPHFVIIDRILIKNKSVLLKKKIFRELLEHPSDLAAFKEVLEITLQKHVVVLKSDDNWTEDITRPCNIIQLIFQLDREISHLQASPVMFSIF